MLDIRARASSFTPSGLLAAQLNNKAVMLLIQLGAHPSFAGFGAAYSNPQFSEYLRKEYHASPRELIRGAARGRNYNYCRILLNRFPGLHNAVLTIQPDFSECNHEFCNRKMPNCDIARIEGLMRNTSSHDTIVDMLVKVAEIYKADKAKLDFFLEGTLYAAGKFTNIKFITDLRLKHLKLDQKANFILAGIAASGNLTTACDFAAQHNIPINRGDSSRDIIIQNAITSGYLREVLSFPALGVKTQDDPAQLDPDALLDGLLISHSLMMSGDLGAYQAYIHRHKHESFTTSFFNTVFSTFELDDFNNQFTANLSTWELIHLEKIYDCSGRIIRKTLLSRMCEILKNADGLLDAITLHYTFAEMSLSFIKRLLRKISHVKDGAENYESFLRRVIKIKTIADKYQFHTEQALEFYINEDLRNYMAACLFHPLYPGIPRDITIYIMKRMSHLSFNELLDMFDKYIMQNAKGFLSYAKLGILPHVKSNLLQQAQNTQNKAELLGLFSQTADRWRDRKSIQAANKLETYAARFK
jgi:hypothetical protein